MTKRMLALEDPRSSGMSVLVLSCSTGQGHNVAAQAIAEEFTRQGVRCTHRNALDFAEGDNVPGIVKNYIVKDAYDDLVMRHPEIFRRLFGIGELISSPRHHSPLFLANSTYADNLGDYIVRKNVDTVICTHMFPAQALAALMGHGCKVASYAVATDYLCLPFWEECAMDYYIVPHHDVVAEFVRRGIPDRKVISLGLPIARAFREPPGREQARMALGLAGSGNVYLVLTGSMGFGRVDEMPRTILASDEDSTVVVMAGANEELLELLGNRYAEERRFRAIGFTDDVVTYLSAADVVLSKPGGLSSTEVASVGRPLVHTPAIPGFESRNAAFFEDRGMSLRVSDEFEAARQAVMLAHDRIRSAKMCHAQHENVDACASTRIFDFVMEQNDARRRG